MNARQVVDVAFRVQGAHLFHLGRGRRDHMIGLREDTQLCLRPAGRQLLWRIAGLPAGARQGQNEMQMADVPLRGEVAADKARVPVVGNDGVGRIGPEPPLAEIRNVCDVLVKLVIGDRTAVGLAKRNVPSLAPFRNLRHHRVRAVRCRAEERHGPSLPQQKRAEIEHDVDRPAERAASRREKRIIRQTDDQDGLDGLALRHKMCSRYQIKVYRG